MKKTSFFSALILSAALARADVLVNGPDVTFDGRNDGEAVVFDTDGGKLALQGTESFASGIEVKQGVNGTLFGNFDGYARMFLGDLLGGGAIVSGAGADSSSLTLEDVVLSGASPNAVSVRDLTLNMHQTTVFKSTWGSTSIEGRSVTFTNCNVNVLKGAEGVCLNTIDSPTINFVNSKLDVNKGATLMFRLPDGDYGDTSVAFDAQSSVAVKGTLVVAGALTSNGASMTVDGDVRIDGGFYMKNGSHLTLNSSNLDGSHGFRTTGEAANLIYIEGDVYLTVNAATRLNFGRETVWTSGPTGGSVLPAEATVHITLGDFEYNQNNFLLQLDYLEWGLDDYYAGYGIFDFDFTNFADYAVVFLKDNIDESVMRQALSHFLIDGQSGLIDFTEVQIGGVSYWALVQAVPEPASVVGVLGLISLGFALYRRRK